MDKWTGKQYSERAIKFRKDTGAESHPVISKGKHPQQWREWYAWYGYRGMAASQELMRESQQSKGDMAEKTVPALSPYEFDASFSLSNPAPEVPNAAPRSTRTPPIFISQEKARDRHRHLPILHTDVSFDQFKALSKARSIPPGAVWVAALGIIYGPEPKSA
jgi:hypothetical protein